MYIYKYVWLDANLRKQSELIFITSFSIDCSTIFKIVCQKNDGEYDLSF